MLERRREEVPLHVVDAEQWNVARECQRLAVADSDEERAHQSGSVGDGDGVQIIQTRPSFFDRALDDGHDAGQMRARGYFGYDTAEYPVHVLRQDHERFLLHFVALALEDRGRSLVA